MIIRPATVSDAPAMTALLNEIIQIGGTTAHQTEMDATLVADIYITGSDVLSAVVAEEEGWLVGWQSVGWWQGEAHIGTYVAPGLQGRRVGQRLFALTCQILLGGPAASILASIRADNAAGLAYYARIGFSDVALNPDFALRDGRIVGRVQKRFDLV